MFYPNILRLLAHQHAISLELAYELWDQVAAHSSAAIGLTPRDTDDWERAMSHFLIAIRSKARVRHSRSD